MSSMHERIDRTVKNWRWWVVFFPAVIIGAFGIAAYAVQLILRQIDWRIDHLLLQMKRWTWPERYQ